MSTALLMPGRGLGRTAIDRARDWLRAVLEVGPLPVVVIEELASEVGVSQRTLRRARSQLGVRSAPAGWQGTRMLSLPPQPIPAEPEREADVTVGLPGRGVAFPAGFLDAPVPRRVVVRRVG